MRLSESKKRRQYCLMSSAQLFYGLCLRSVAHLLTCCFSGNVPLLHMFRYVSDSVLPGLPTASNKRWGEKAWVRLPKSSIKSYTLSLQTTWTGFNPYLYSGRSSSAGPTLVEKRSFILNRGIVTDNVCHTPGARMVCSAFHSTKAVVSQVGALLMCSQACWD